MKIQDIVFLAVFAILFIFYRKPKVFVWAGIISLLVSIPLFAGWIFFTAQRLVTYSFFFLLIAILLMRLGYKPKV